jgi:hypothetical protein
LSYCSSDPAVGLAWRIAPSGRSPTVTTSPSIERSRTLHRPPQGLVESALAGQPTGSAMRRIGERRGTQTTGRSKLRQTAPCLLLLRTSRCSAAE